MSKMTRCNLCGTPKHPSDPFGECQKCGSEQIALASFTAGAEAAKLMSAEEQTNVRISLAELSVILDQTMSTMVSALEGYVDERCKRMDKEMAGVRQKVRQQWQRISNLERNAGL
jgi:hypothetical protein